MRFVKLDKVAFKREGLQIGIAEKNIKIIHLGDHGGHLRCMFTCMEIAADTVLQIDGLTDIDDLPLMLHQVAAGAVGQQ